MPTRRHLLEMYQTGREVTFSEGVKEILDAQTQEPMLDDDTGAPLTESLFAETVWVQKLSDLDHKAAVRKADAAKARAMAESHDRESEAFLAARNFVYETMNNGNREVMIEYLVGDKLAARQEAIGAEVEGERDSDDEPGEWKKDNYLQGLYDSWNGTADEPGLKVMYAAHPDDPEANRVFEEIKRFVGQVDERLKDERVEVVAEFDGMDDDALLDKVTELHLEATGNVAWFSEFDACRVWLGTRKADKHREYYLQSRADVDKMPPIVFNTILAAIEEMTVELTEGKGSPATRTSSP